MLMLGLNEAIDQIPVVECTLVWSSIEERRWSLLIGALELDVKCQRM